MESLFLGCMRGSICQCSDALKTGSLVINGERAGRATPTRRAILKAAKPHGRGPPSKGGLLKQGAINE